MPKNTRNFKTKFLKNVDSVFSGKILLRKNPKGDPLSSQNVYFQANSFKSEGAHFFDQMLFFEKTSRSAENVCLFHRC